MITVHPRSLNVSAHDQDGSLERSRNLRGTNVQKRNFQIDKFKRAYWGGLRFTDESGPATNRTAERTKQL